MQRTTLTALIFLAREAPPAREVFGPDAKL